MALKVSNCQRLYYVWKTEEPQVGVSRKSPIFCWYDSEWFFELEARYDQVYNIGNSFVLGNLLWCMYLKTMKLSKTFHNLQITVFIADKDEKLISIGFKSVMCELMWPEYESKILPLRSDLMVNGSLTFVFVLDPLAQSMSDLEQLNELGKQWFETLCQTEFSQEIEKMLDDPEHSDMQLICNDQERFFVHKCILAARSEVFAAMFRSGMSECNSGVVAIEDIESPILHLLLRYLYSGKMDMVTVENVSFLYEAAHKYVVDSLRQKCVRFMIENLTVDNACDVLLFSENYGDEQLKDATISFMINKEGFLLSQVWKNFTTVNQSICFQVVQKAYEKLKSS